MKPLLVDMREAAEVLSVGRTTVYDLAGKGQIETVTIGRRRLVKVESLERYVRRLADHDQ